MLGAQYSPRHSADPSGGRRVIRELHSLERTGRARSFTADILFAYGANRADAAIVADHLVDSDVAGVRSHGLIRVPQYVDEILAGEVDPGASPAIARLTATRVEVEGGRCFGQTACVAAVSVGSEMSSESGIALVTVRNIGHAGRIGAYAEELGRGGFLSIIFCSGPRSGHRVAPFNGREGRLGPNPIAYSIPTEGAPIVGDFSTSSAPEGRIRRLQFLGQLAPPDTLLDSAGRPTTDPGVLYCKEPGTILPLGGARLGHRGFALGLLVEGLATLLAGDESADGSRIGNNVAMVIVPVDDGFCARARRMAQYVSSSVPSGGDPVILPGEPEQRHQAASLGIDVDATTWAAIVERAERRHVPVPDR